MSKNRPTWPVSLARENNCPLPDEVKIAATKSSRTGTVSGDIIDPEDGEAQAMIRKMRSDLGFSFEPPDGIEPSTYALRVRRSAD